jgi:hypothetical protein
MSKKSTQSGLIIMFSTYESRVIEYWMIFLMKLKLNILKKFGGGAGDIHMVRLCQAKCEWHLAN